MLKRLNKGQSTMEYVFLIALVAMAFLAMNFYLRRGFQGRWKDSVDELGDQYDPRYSNGTTEYTISANTTTTIWREGAPGGYWTMKEDITNSLETKSGFMAVADEP